MEKTVIYHYVIKPTKKNIISTYNAKELIMVISKRENYDRQFFTIDKQFVLNGKKYQNNNGL